MYVIREGGVRITFHDSHHKLDNGEFKTIGSESGERDSEVRVLGWRRHPRALLMRC